MRFHSISRRSRNRSKAQRAPQGHSVRRLRFETFEDRRMLSFTPAVNHPTIGTPSFIVTADFNGDGNLDLATCANATTGSISVLLGDGEGGFGAVQRTVFGSGLRSLAVADFNNDTRPDLFVSDLYNGASAVIGNGDGTFQQAIPLNLSGGAGKEAVALGRSSHGSTEILVTWLGPDWQTFVQVYAGNLQYGFTAGQEATYWGWSAMAPVDLNSDGPLDVVTGDGSIFLGDINQFLYFHSQPYPLAGTAIATGDFTSDGNADVIVAGSSVAVLRGNGDGTFLAPLHHPASGTYHSVIATADFNGDGKLDAIMTDDDTGAVSVFLGNGDGTLDYAGAFVVGTSPSGIAVGDFNGDGRPDVAVSNAGFESRTVSVLLNDGVWPGAGPAPGDFDGDGDVDGRDFLAWQRNPSVGPLSDWQEEYAGEGSGVGGQGGEEIAEFGIRIAESEESQEVRVEEETGVGGQEEGTGDGGQGGEEIAEFGIRIAAGRAVSVSARSSPVTNVHGSPKTLETTRNGIPCYAEKYVEEVDRAMEQLAAVPSGARSFGEMVTRRGVKTPHPALSPERRSWK